MCELSIVYGIERNIGKRGVSELVSMMGSGSRLNDDGWGVFNDAGLITKSPDEFKSSELRAKLMGAYAESRFVVGHIRLATHGDHTDENTHPFKWKGLILAHNGVITNESELRKKYGIPDKPAVDSFVVAWLIAHHRANNQGDIVRAIHATCDELEGWYSVFVYHIKRKRLYYFRHNAEFTFRLVETRKGNHYIVGNTKSDHLKHGFTKTVLGFSVSDAEVLATEKPESNTLYEITEEGLQALIVLPEPKPTVITVEPKKGKAIYHYGSYRRWLRDEDITPYQYLTADDVDKMDKMGSYGSED